MKRAWAQIVVAVAFITGGGALFSWTQHIPFLTGLYWSTTTATTVGYGDVIPRNDLGRFISICMMLTAIPLLAAAFARLTGEHLAKRAREEITELRAHVHALLAEHHPNMVAEIHDRLDNLTDHIHERLDSIEAVLNGDEPPRPAIAAISENEES
jgi:voltage-gated potassium channel Kch